MNTAIPALTPVGPVVIVAPLSGGPDLSHSAGFATARKPRDLLPAQRPSGLKE